MLSTAKMGVMFCLVQSVRKSFVKHAGTQDALLVLATHSNADVQLRAAKMIRSLTADSEVLLAFREWHRLIEILYVTLMMFVMSRSASIFVVLTHHALGLASSTVHRTASIACRQTHTRKPRWASWQKLQGAIPIKSTDCLTRGI